MLAEVFWQTGLPPWRVMRLRHDRRSFVIASALWKARQKRLEAGEEELPPLEREQDPLEAIRAWTARFGGDDRG